MEMETIKLAGTAVVAAATVVQLTSIDTPCGKVRLMAPSDESVNGVNTSKVYVYVDYSGAEPTRAVVIAGGRYLGIANYEGILIEANNGSKVYLAGATDDDEVIFQIIGG